ncbi:MAG: TldD/PmbA family protein [Geminocystis sp.]|nr:TldD/PmbA family protein [Geminocystis sp.]
MFMTAEKLLELARKKGIKDVEVYQVESVSRPIVFSANRLKQMESSQVSGIALRLWYEGKSGLAVAYGEAPGEELIDKAISVAQCKEEEEEVLLNERNCLVYNSLQEDLPLATKDEQVINQCRQAIEKILNYYPEAIVGIEAEWEKETTTLVNSRGLYCQQTDLSYSVSMGVELVRDENFLGVYDGEYARHLVSLQGTTNRILERLSWAKENKWGIKGILPVLFTPNGAVTLWETVSSALNGKLVLEKSSPWSDRLGEQVLSSLITLSQKPDFQPYDCPFDDEGTPTQPLTLIDRGVLNCFYTDKKTAKLLKINNTGNGFRPSLANYPSPDLVNLVVAAGDKSFEELAAGMEYGIVVDQVLGGGADISGDFSVNLDLGYLVREGEIVARLKDTMLTGNVYQCLQEVVALGNDSRWVGSCYTPSILVEGLSVVSENR